MTTVTFADSERQDDKGRAIEIATKDVLALPRTGETLILEFPNMPPQVYTVSGVVHLTILGGGNANENVPTEWQSLPPHMLQMAQQLQLQRTQQAQPVSGDRVLVMLRKLPDQAASQS